MENDTIKVIEINKIIKNEKQPRKNFDEEKLNELAASIKEQGILQPLLVEKTSSGQYKIIAGERRYRAAEIAGIKKIPVIVKKFNNLQKMQVAIIENVQREELNPIEEAYAYMYLMHEGGMTQEEVAKKVGKSRSSIANTVRLVSLQPSYVQSLINGEITSGHARALLSMQNPSDRDFLYNEIVKNGLSVRDSEKLASFLNNGGRINGEIDILKIRNSVLSYNNEKPENPLVEETSNGNPNATTSKSSPNEKAKKIDIDEKSIIREMEERLSLALDMNVKLKGSSKCGIMQIAYVSYEELNSLYKRLGSTDDLIREE